MLNRLPFTDERETGVTALPDHDRLDDGRIHVRRPCPLDHKISAGTARRVIALHHELHRGHRTEFGGRLNIVAHHLPRGVVVAGVGENHGVLPAHVAHADGRREVHHELLRLEPEIDARVHGHVDPALNVVLGQGRGHGLQTVGRTAEGDGWTRRIGRRTGNRRPEGQPDENRSRWCAHQSPSLRISGMLQHPS